MDEHKENIHAVNMSHGHKENIHGQEVGVNMSHEHKENIHGQEVGVNMSHGHKENIHGQEVGVNMSHEHKENIHGQEVGVNMSHEHKENIHGQEVGVNMSHEHKENIHGQEVGVNMSHEHKENIHGQEVGVNMSHEHKENIHGQEVGVNMSHEHKENIHGQEVGVNMSHEHKENIHGQEVGVNMSHEHKENIHGQEVGVNMSHEHKENIHGQEVGVNMSHEHKENIHGQEVGVNMSHEHKENIHGQEVGVNMSHENEKVTPGSPICPSGDHAPEASQSNSDFSHPVYKEIAMANGHINRMTRDELHSKLAELKLDTRGVKDVMKKRLKSHYKKQKLTQSTAEGGPPADTYYDYICVVDFEATCEEDNPADFLHEIIEFPMVLISTHTLEIVETFQEYVKPELNPKLSDFCVQLTGITQEMVDAADTFPDVLRRVVLWLQQKKLGTKYKYAFLTDGAWDMSKFLNIQCRTSQIRYPQFARRWINIRKSYGNFYKVPRTQTKLSTMLDKLGLEYEGRPHSGLDDSRNIARIALRMLQDGCQLRVNERMHAGQLLTVPSSATLEGAPPPRWPRNRK
ncbi:3'-5' exoribonuclease 1 [Entelurus aequoreus]|uniref:3'-5' exoribonuclease 1 n=1 Tax=Entelurus aequoreus TaxID=161455 RepID=UPI002B1D8A3E|nr:3'-5' exoribonuclease 1 [Entelurus aequoreus]